MTPESFILDLDAVSIHRGDETVLNNLTWRMLPGENWAILGANGSGKSSFAAALTGEAASSGEIRYGFDDGRRDPCERIASVSFRLHREFVAQSDSYYQSRWYLGDEDHTLTAGKVLRAAAGRSKDAAARLAHVVKLMDIRRVLKRQTLHLSTGEMRRVLIARALLLKPALLILDEPFIGLDVSGRAGLKRSLAAIMRAGQPILFLTARPNDAEMPQGLTHAMYLRDGAVLGTARLSSARAKKLQRATFAKAPRVTPPLTAVKQPRRQPDAAPVIALTDINLSMGGVSILKHVNWSVRPGERWSVSGPNGAGKTTMLSLLNGDHPQAFAQDVRLFGRTRGDFTLFELKALIGWASPDIALHYGNQTSALEFVCTGFFETLGLYQSCSRRQQQIARKWIAYFGLTAAADRPFRVLSDAQQRLALLARALVKPRRLVVLDEPCQGLDPASQELVLRAIDTFCRQAQTALVIVTHYASELPSCITHRLELEAGRVRRAGRI